MGNRSLVCCCHENIEIKNEQQSGELDKDLYSKTTLGKSGSGKLRKIL
jgi:hypothetical protein